MTLVHAVCFGVQWLSAKNVIIKRTQSCSNASVSLFPSISLSYWFLCLALIKIYPFIPVVIMVTFLYVLVSHWKLLDIYSLTNRAKGRETNRTRGRRGAGGGDGGLLHPSTDPLILLVLVISPVSFFSCCKCRHTLPCISALETLWSLFLSTGTLCLAIDDYIGMI